MNKLLMVVVLSVPALAMAQDYTTGITEQDMAMTREMEQSGRYSPGTLAAFARFSNPGSAQLQAQQQYMDNEYLNNVMASPQFAQRSRELVAQNGGDYRAAYTMALNELADPGVMARVMLNRQVQPPVNMNNNQRPQYIVIQQQPRGVQPLPQFKPIFNDENMPHVLPPQ